MIKLRKALNTYLKSLHPRIYFANADTDALFPYVVYDAQIITDGENGAIATIDIDGWDSNDTNDTTVIENLMQTINALDKHTIINDEIAVTFYLENELTLSDPDTRIKRRKNIYQAKIFYL